MDLQSSRCVHAGELQEVFCVPLQLTARAQLGWSDWRLNRVHFVTDAAAAAAAAAQSQVSQKKQTSDGMLLWLPLQRHQVLHRSSSLAVS
jgi:hypothetical protein